MIIIRIRKFTPVLLAFPFPAIAPLCRVAEFVRSRLVVRVGGGGRDGLRHRTGAGTDW
jgi:hypothetical protein